MPLGQVRAELDEMGVDPDPAIARVLKAVHAARAAALAPPLVDEQEGE
jgi:hypothetical protein